MLFLRLLFVALFALSAVQSLPVPQANGAKRPPPNSSGGAADASKHPKFGSSGSTDGVKASNEVSAAEANGKSSGDNLHICGFAIKTYNYDKECKDNVGYVYLDPDPSNINGELRKDDKWQGE